MSLKDLKNKKKAQTKQQINEHKKGLVKESNQDLVTQNKELTGKTDAINSRQKSF